MGIGPEKKPLMRRLQPWIGGLIMVITLVPLGLLLTSGKLDTKAMGGLATGLFMAGGGASLIAKGTSRKSSFVGFVVGAIVTSTAVISLLRS